MVRRIVGVLVEIGRGALAPASTAAFIAGPSSLPARLTAPPSGLFLRRVDYEKESHAGAMPLRAVTPLSASGGEEQPGHRLR